MVGVKTSLRCPCCLSKKRIGIKRSLGENLSEAPKADSRGENLIEAPLLSLEKRKKRKRVRKRKKKEAETEKTGLIFGNCCRLQGFNAKRRPLNSRTRVPTKLPGNVTCTPSMNTHFFQGLDTIWS